MPTTTRTERIAELNDHYRRSAERMTITQGVDALTVDEKLALVRAVAQFSDFNNGNDPHGERDFGKITMGGVDYFWKIDYFDKSLEYGSEDPADPDVTTRVLTIMRADEY